jgi:hypothetical protein
MSRIGVVGVLVAAMACGCSTVQIVQRDGCWVRRTESFPKNVKEEIGVCSRPPPVWSNDRVARLVQECMAESDYRWQNEALAAWNQGRPLPPQQDEHAVMQHCMTDAATAVVTENEALKKRLSELTTERDAMRSEAAEDRAKLRESQEHMTDALGEAAKRPAPNAFATSNSSGTATTRSDQQTSSELQDADPAAPITPIPVIEPLPDRPAPAPRPTKKHAAPPSSCALPGASGPECAPPPPGFEPK